MVTEKQFQSREHYVATIVDEVLACGWFDDGRHHLNIDGSKYEITVRDLRTNSIVAYSSTKADFDQSLVEFANDYFA
jgi:hypothetical protein